MGKAEIVELLKEWIKSAYDEDNGDLASKFEFILGYIMTNKVDTSKFFENKKDEVISRMHLGDEELQQVALDMYRKLGLKKSIKIINNTIKQLRRKKESVYHSRNPFCLTYLKRSKRKDSCDKCPYTKIHSLYKSCLALKVAYINEEQYYKDKIEDYSKILKYLDMFFRK